MRFESRNFTALFMVLVSHLAMGGSHSNMGENPFEEYRTAQMRPQKITNPNIAIKDKEAELNPDEQRAVDTLDRLHNSSDNVTEQDLQDLKTFLDSPEAEDLLDENYLTAMRERVNATLASVAITRERSSLPISFGSSSEESNAEDSFSNLLNKTQSSTEEVVSPLSKVINKNFSALPVKSISYNSPVAPVSTNTNPKTAEPMSPSLLGSSIESITNLPSNAYSKVSGEYTPPVSRVGLKSLEEDYFKTTSSENFNMNMEVLNNEKISRPIASVSAVVSPSLNPTVGAISETRPTEFFDFSPVKTEEVPLNDLASKTEELEISVENTQIEPTLEKTSFVDSVKNWLDGFTQKNEEKEIVKMNPTKVTKKTSKTLIESKINKGSDLSQLLDSIEISESL